jgi:hypothetical protein
MVLQVTGLQCLQADTDLRFSIAGIRVHPKKHCRAMKKELVGNFKNNGTELRPQREFGQCPRA